MKQGKAKALAKNGPPGHALTLAQVGLDTDLKFAKLMEAIIADLGRGEITPQIALAMCNASGKLLKMLELKHRFGKSASEGGPKTLQLT
jgi:hypothetical protein